MCCTGPRLDLHSGFASYTARLTSLCHVYMASKQLSRACHSSSISAAHDIHPCISARRVATAAAAAHPAGNVTRSCPAPQPRPPGAGASPRPGRRIASCDLPTSPSAATGLRVGLGGPTRTELSMQCWMKAQRGFHPIHCRAGAGRRGSFMAAASAASDRPQPAWQAAEQ